jgi:tetratricopeptide (TPR) repeat protein
MIIATPPKTIRTDSGCDKPPEPPQSIRNFSCDFLLLWNWETSSGHLENVLEYETMMEINSLVTNHSERDLERAIRLSHVAVVLEDSEVYKGAEHRLREAIGDYEKVLGREHPDTLTALDNLGMVYKKKKQWKKSEELVLEVLETRKRVQGVDHPGTLNSIANLASIYRDRGFWTG